MQQTLSQNPTNLEVNVGMDNNRKNKVKKGWLKKFKGICKKYNVPPDVIDFYSMDWGLTYPELKAEVMKVIEGLSTETVRVSAEKITKEDIEEKEAESDANYVAKVHEEEKKAIEKLKFKQPNVDKYFKTMREYIGMVAGGYTTNLILEGEGGYSKSFETYKILLDMSYRIDRDFTILSGFSSPLEFYHLLYKYKDFKVVVLDDIDGILNSEKGISILKSALWSVSSQRVVEYYSTTERLKVPSKFPINANFIIILNKIENERDRGVQALLSRAIHYKVDFSYLDLMGLFRGIAVDTPYKDLTKEERLEVVDYISEITNEATVNLNIRSLLKAYDIYRYAKNNGWKKLMKDMFVEDEMMKFVMELIESKVPVKEQVAKFVEGTGRKRATYYRIKKRVMERKKSHYLKV